MEKIARLFFVIAIWFYTKQKVVETWVFPSISTTFVLETRNAYLTTSFLTAIPFPSTVMRSV